jgi:hypothetical protein
MLRITTYFLTALFTFLAGVAIYSTYHFGVELLSDEAFNHPSVQVPPVDQPQLQVPLRLGIFVGVDGTTFSSDNTKFDFFDDYKDREKVIIVSAAELSDIVGKLAAAGLLEEKQSNSSYFVSLPVDNTFYISWADRIRMFTWIHDSECRVPEKYLSILEEVNVRHHDPLITNFVDYNRRNAPNHLCDSAESFEPTVR